MPRFSMFVVLCAAAVALSCRTADASIISYTTQASWAAATLSPSTINFESLPFTGPATFLPGATTIDQVAFGSNLFSNNQVWGTGIYLMGSGPVLGISTKPGTVSVGSLFMAYFGNPSTFTITAYSDLSGPASPLVINPGTGQGFFGFVADGTNEHITFINIQQSSGSNYTAVDNFSYSTVPLPEPASATILGVLSLAGVLRRTRHAAACL